MWPLGTSTVTHRKSRLSFTQTHIFKYNPLLPGCLLLPGYHPGNTEQQNPCSSNPLLSLQQNPYTYSCRIALLQRILAARILLHQSSFQGDFVAFLDTSNKIIVGKYKNSLFDSEQVLKKAKFRTKVITTLQLRNIALKPHLIIITYFIYSVFLKSAYHQIKTD